MGRAHRRAATASRLHASPSPRPVRRRRAPRTPARASAARTSQRAASLRPAPRLPPRPPPCSLARGSRRRAPTSQGMLISVGPRSAESQANCIASAASGLPGAPRALRAVRLAVDGKRGGAARFPLAAPPMCGPPRRRRGSRPSRPHSFGVTLPKRTSTPITSTHTSALSVWHRPNGTLYPLTHDTPTPMTTSHASIHKAITAFCRGVYGLDLDGGE